MTSRFTSSFGTVYLRLSNYASRRCFAQKIHKSSAVKPAPSISKLFNAQKQKALLNYINNVYRGHDERLLTFQSTMDEVCTAKIEFGPFESLDDLVTKACLSHKAALDLCNQISKFALKKRSVQLSYPTMTAEESEKVDSILAIHTSLYCVVWTHLEKSGRVLSWHKEPILLGEKEKHTIDGVHAVMNFHNKIPVADAYIMETPALRRSKTLSDSNNNFLLNCVNCSVLTLVSCLHAKDNSRAKLYYMNRCIVPYLFNLSVGVEIVSRFRTVEDLIDKKFPLERLNLRGLTMDDWLRDLFTESNDKTKEELSIALLAAVAAMEVLVRRNPYAIEKVMTS